MHVLKKWIIASSESKNNSITIEVIILFFRKEPSYWFQWLTDSELQLDFLWCQLNVLRISVTRVGTTRIIIRWTVDVGRTGLNARRQLIESKYHQRIMRIVYKFFWTLGARSAPWAHGVSVWMTPWPFEYLQYNLQNEERIQLNLLNRLPFPNPRSSLCTVTSEWITYRETLRVTY